MDFMASLFTFDQIDELLQLSSFPCQQQHTIQQNSLLETTPFLNGNYNTEVTGDPKNSRGRKSSVASRADIDDSTPIDYKRKKIIHRDVERQRRQEMAALYKSLRSLLPLQYLKGKRSISDHMHEAAVYIRHLQKRIEELDEKRDELKSSSNAKFTEVGSVPCLPVCRKERTVTVETCRSGVQVIFCTALRGGVPVSRVLDVIIRKGLNVVSCISTSIDERFLHTIECEVSDGKSINTSELLKKLTALEA